MTLLETSTRFVGKPERGPAMYFSLILTIFSGVQYKLGGRGVERQLRGGEVG